jgi:hypothetical protein
MKLKDSVRSHPCIVYCCLKEDFKLFVLEEGFVGSHKDRNRRVTDMGNHR